MDLRLQPVKVETGSADQEGQLVFDGEFLVAVIVKLSDEHGELVGQVVLGSGVWQDCRSESPFVRGFERSAGLDLETFGGGKLTRFVGTRDAELSGPLAALSRMREELGTISYKTAHPRQLSGGSAPRMAKDTEVVLKRR